MIAGSCWERVEMRRIGSRERQFEIIEKERGKVNVVSVVGLAKGLRFEFELNEIKCWPVVGLIERLRFEFELNQMLICFLYPCMPEL